MDKLVFQDVGQLNGTNFLRYVIGRGVENGIELDQIVYLLLLPLIAVVIAAARYVIGIRGFGIFTPVMLAVVFVIMGVVPGVSLFMLIIGMATLARMIMRKLKIHYLARMALVVWVVCLAIIGTMVSFRLAILPVLLLILLAENFVEAQISQSPNKAVQLTLETFLMAMGCYGLLSWLWLQRLALAQPEILLLATVGLNLVIGRFTGMRLLEYQRFRRLVK